MRLFVIFSTLLFIAPLAVRDFSEARPEDVTDGVERLRGGALFFTALALLTFTGGWHGLRVLRAKRNPAALRTPFNITLHLLNVLIALPLWLFCVRDAEPLYGFFGTLCLLSGMSDLWKLRRPSHDPRYWLYEHLSSMIGTGIAAHTAFLAFGAVRLVPRLYSLSPAFYVIPWIAPTGIGVLAITWLQRRYRKNSAGAEKMGTLLTNLWLCQTSTTWSQRWPICRDASTPRSSGRLMRNGAGRQSARRSGTVRETA